MHRDGDLRCIAFSRIKGRLRRLSSRVQVNKSRYDKCIEIAIPGASPPPHRGGFAAFPSRVQVGNSRYDRCIEMAISGASVFCRITGGFAALSSRVLVQSAL
jgi:hypothetical protein